MRLYISCSKRFYGEVERIKRGLDDLGHFVTPPNGWNDAASEGLISQLDAHAYVAWKGDMMRKNSEIVSQHDGILILNLPSDNTAGYIGGASFSEAFKAFELKKSIFLYSPISDSVFRAELIGMNPIVIHGDLRNIPL